MTRRSRLFLLLAGLGLVTGALVHLTHRPPPPPEPAPEAAPGAEAPPKARVPGFRRMTGVTALVVLEGRILAEGDATGRIALHRLDAPDPAAASTDWWAAHDAPIRRLWGLDEGGLASASADGSVGLWNADGSLRRRLRLPDAHLNDAVPHAGESTVYVAADRGSVARLCDPEPCWRHQGVHGAAAFAVAFSPDGTRLATGGMDGQLALRDPTLGERVAQWRVGPGWVTALAWTAEGLFVGDNGGKVRFIAGGDPEATPELLEAGAGPVLVLLAQGDTLLAGTEDGRVSLFGRADRQRRAQVVTGSPVRALATDADTVYTGCADGSIRRYTRTPTALVPGAFLVNGVPPAAAPGEN
jgi:WD40 repeat protein